MREIHAAPYVPRIAVSKAALGTGMWLVKGDEFRLWLEPNGDIKIFWGSGIPGAGKTLLASIVIERLEALCKEKDVQICVCYVYFRYSDRSEMTVRDVLEILVMQTLERHPDCLAVVERTYARHLRERTEPTEAQLLSLLRQLNGAMAVTFYVLDALDEAPIKIQLAVVKTLASLDVKLFITSRPLKTMEANFPEAHTFHIVAQDADIDLLIAKRIGENAELQRLLQVYPFLRNEIISTIKQNCSGMFLHASLQLDALCESLNLQDVRDTLKAFPSSIEGVYRQTWSRISNQCCKHASLAKAVLVWVLNALRPMTMGELERAVATCPYTHKFGPYRHVPGASLVSLCGGLITIEEESKVVRLVHYTAKETIEGLLHEAVPHPHSLLAAVCMTHLADCGFQNTTIGSEEEFKTVLEKDPLLAYASEAWAFHARTGLDEEDTERRTAQFVRESKAFPAFTGFDRTSYFDILTPLHILGLYDLPLALIEDTAMGNPNVTTKVYRQSPLMVASQTGHESIVAFLLPLSDIQVNLMTREGWTALMRAASAGHEGIINLLLTHPRILVNLINNEGRSATMLAARNGHTGVVVLLLAHPGVQLNATDNNAWSALMLAARNGQTGAVALLLAHPGIQANLADHNMWLALMLAARNGHTGVAALLLAHPGIQVNLLNNDGWSALMMAARNGPEGIIRLFLAHPEIQVNLVNKQGYSALMEAARNGHSGAVTLLLAHAGIQANLVNNEGWSALMFAAKFGHTDVAGLLLVHPGVQVNLFNDEGWPALLVAARYGPEGTVKLLLAHPRILVNPVNNDGWSALMMAARYGHAGVVALLLPHSGIQVNLVNNGGWSALMMAARYGQTRVLALLLAHTGIQVNLVNSNGWSALMMAAKYGPASTVKLLQQHPGIQINLANNRGLTALLLASERGDEAVVELLLAANGIDPNVFDNDGDTAIKVAAQEGHGGVVRLLLALPNIDTTISSTTNGHTAISAAHDNSHSDIVDLLEDFESRMVIPTWIPF
ncbi:ankyrin repeat-containing domain protein [Coprinopsis sp. MPI-PUGE-AT-0042]|nr:ankyrin repeat-containing domain protein [Coprinopsis sp. MPI-PUGE-AT-0042]